MSCYEQTLLYASQNGHLEIVQALLKQDLNINCSNIYGWTPLHEAVFNEKFEIVKILVENDAEINCENEHMGTPLHFASRKGFLEIVKYLVEKGAKIDAQNINKTCPIHFAVINETCGYEMTEFFIKKGTVWKFQNFT